MKNENISSEMIDVLSHCHKYEPKWNNDLHQLFFGGDQLTSERARNGQMAVQDGDTAESRLDGIICKCEEWHTLFTLLQLLFNSLYKDDSDSDFGTLKQLQIAINRRVSKNVKNDVATATEFVDIVLDAHVTVAAMKVLGIDSVSNTPTSLQGISDWSETKKRLFLYSTAETVVDQYILRDHHTFLDRSPNMRR